MEYGCTRHDFAFWWQCCSITQGLVLKINTLLWQPSPPPPNTRANSIKTPNHQFSSLNFCDLRRLDFGQYYKFITFCIMFKIGWCLCLYCSSKWWKTSDMWETLCVKMFSGDVEVNFPISFSNIHSQNIYPACGRKIVKSIAAFTLKHVLGTSKFFVNIGTSLNVTVKGKSHCFCYGLIWN